MSQAGVEIQVSKQVVSKMQILRLIVQLSEDLKDWGSRRLCYAVLATQTGLCLGPRFIVSSEGLALGEMEFAHMLTPGERPSSTEIRTCNQT